MNIVVKLININRTNNNISANYIPEGSKERGFLVVDLKTSKLVESRLTSLDGFTKLYCRYARYGLVEIKDDIELPKEKVIMWY